MSKSIEVTDETFQSEVLQASEPTLIDFWATWCGPCKMVAPVVDAIAESYGGRLKVVKMDVDNNPQTPQSLGIMSIPTLILFKSGKEITRVVGFRPKDVLAETLSPYID